MKNNKRSFIVVASIASAVLLIVAAYSAADEFFEHHGQHDKENNRSHGDKNHGSKHATPVASDSSYTSSCGGCHWAYPPALLPSKSWGNIMATLNDHFGNEVILTAQQRDDISRYVLTHAADKSSLKIGGKITQSLAGSVPGRIVEIPYIIRKHRKIDQAVFSRKSVKSLSNCIACHPSASRAFFDDDDAKIPSE